MFNKHEEKYISSEETLKKEVNTGALNHPLERTVDLISLSMTYTEFRKPSLGMSLWCLKLGKVHCSLRQQLGPQKKHPAYNTGHQ